jgi:hypothetical protein
VSGRFPKARMDAYRLTTLQQLVSLNMAPTNITFAASPWREREFPPSQQEDYWCACDLVTVVAGWLGLFTCEHHVRLQHFRRDIAGGRRRVRKSTPVRPTVLDQFRRPADTYRNRRYGESTLTSPGRDTWAMCSRNVQGQHGTTR